MDIHISLDVKRHHYNKKLFYIQYPANQPAVTEQNRHFLYRTSHFYISR